MQLINPYSSEGRSCLAPLPGTHIIAETLGLLGSVINDPNNPARIWSIQALYTPVHGRALGGIRAKLTDQKGFVTFCNQRDLEVLLGIAEPGEYCKWLDRDYAAPGDRDWLGFCVDEQDLIDDLYDRELELRAQFTDNSVLPTGLNFERRVHDGTDNDYSETMQLLWDFDPETGRGPDTRLTTVAKRWVRIERSPYRERRRLWKRI